ncbi:MAG: stage III sporulation protein AE [Burkholderiales bacterium]
MKKAVIIVLIALCMLAFPSSSHATDEEEIDRALEDEITRNIESALGTADLHEIEEYFNKYADTLRPITGGVDLKTFVIMLAKGGADFQITDVYSLVLDSMFGGVKQSIPAIVQIIVIALLFSIITHFKPSFGDTGVSKAAQTAQFVIIGTITIGILSVAFSIGAGAIKSMTSFTSDLFPLLITLLTALGGITSAAILSPATVFLTTGISIFFSSVIMPLVIVLTVFTIINNFSTSIKLTGFCALIKTIVKWAIGLSFTIFLGIIAIQGLLGSTFDGISIKTAKYTIDKLVPIIGGMVSDSVDVLISCTLLIKNAIGIAGIIIIAAIAITPVFGILAHYFLFKLTGAVLEPVGGKPIGKFATASADVLLLLFAAVVAAAAMFFITVAVIIGAGNTNVMLR